MKPLRKPAPWACLSTSFAMALGLDIATFNRLAGHDGGEIIFPDLPEPQCRRGFHVSEAVRVALNLGYSATPFELFPVIAPSRGEYEPHVVLYGEPQYREPDGNWAKFETVVSKQGVLECRTRSGNWHAVAFSHLLIHDPDGGAPYVYSQGDMTSRGLYPVRAWRVEKYA